MNSCKASPGHACGCNRVKFGDNYLPGIVDAFRGVSATSQSVKAYTERNQRTVQTDIGRILSDATIKKIQLQTQADRRREEGRWARKAAGMSAFSTMLGGISNFHSVG